MAADRERVRDLLRLTGDPEKVAALLGTDRATVEAVEAGTGALPASGGGGGQDVQDYLHSSGLDFSSQAGFDSGSGNLLTPGGRWTPPDDFPDGDYTLFLSHQSNTGSITVWLNGDLDVGDGTSTSYSPMIFRADGLGGGVQVDAIHIPKGWTVRFEVDGNAVVWNASLVAATGGATPTPA